MVNRESGIQTDTHTDVSTISCDGVINNDRTRALEKVWNTLKQNEKFNVILDLSQVNNIYSCGLGLLVKMHKEAQANKGMLVVTGVQGYALAIFTSTRLSKLLYMAADHSAAVQLFDLQRKKIEEALEAERKAAENEVIIKQTASIKKPSKRIPCWEYFQNNNPANATNCDECYKKSAPSLDPCWIVQGLIEGISFQYVNEECETCDYFLEFSRLKNTMLTDNNKTNNLN